MSTWSGGETLLGERIFNFQHINLQFAVSHVQNYICGRTILLLWTIKLGCVHCMGTSRLKPIFLFFSVDKNYINVIQVLRGYKLIISPQNKSSTMCMINVTPRKGIRQIYSTQCLNVLMLGVNTVDTIILFCLNRWYRIIIWIGNKDHIFFLKIHYFIYSSKCLS